MSGRDRPTSPSAPSAPRDTEEARSLLQARIAQFGRVGMTIALVFLAIAVVINLTMTLEGMRGVAVAQTCSVVIGGATWLLARGRRLGTRVLEAIDIGSTFATNAVFIALGWALPIWTRPDLLQLLCVTEILALRAFLVPSTPRRTATIGGITVVAIVVSTWLQYTMQGRPHPLAPDAFSYAVIASCAGFASVLVTTLTSRTIFGLRQSVREASELGQYTLLEKIGEGGMGIVYKARHAMLRRQTAIKLLPAERAGEDNLSRFEREAQLTSLLTHPNTVSIYDYGRTADGVLYYAMEYLDGVDLETLVELDGPQPPSRVVHILRQVSGALDEAHGVGLIHRDVKPANVFLCMRKGGPDLVKVLDFGLVKSLNAPQDAARTGSYQILGTPLFMSPEAISSPEKLDARSDLYAVGALGYYLLTGVPPFTGTSVMEVCAQHLHTAPLPPAERLGRDAVALDHLLLRCLAKSPDARPASAAVLVRELDTCSEGLTWNGDDAEAWWQTREAELEARRSRTSTSGVQGVQTNATVAVDLKKRRRALP